MNIFSCLNFILSYQVNQNNISWHVDIEANLMGPHPSIKHNRWLKTFEEKSLSLL